MSTTFTIIPTKIDNDLTFQSVLSLANQTLKNQLDKLLINLSVGLSVNIHDNKEAYVNNINLNTKFIWADNEYAWFTVDKSNGGTDAYCEKLSEHLSDWDTYIQDTLGNVIVTPQLKQQITGCEYEWYFRRSAGQSPIISLAYGHLSAAVAKLTDGYIYTYDGAWHDNIFPATADQLLEVYFYPDKANNDEDYDWATRCIEGLKTEFDSR
ncbi:MAG: hypothetical protein E6H09_04105 [Bacteroidetes bacterium]|jgi:hypothetical protein|nr:MAG: hypothetical protein E6H09_04105 [Bacteroidota bacterium]